MTEKFNTAALQLIAALTRGDQEQATAARLTIFDDAMGTIAEQQADLKLEADIKELMEQTGAASENAPLINLYKLYFMGFYSGLEASLLLNRESN